MGDMRVWLACSILGSLLRGLHCAHWVSTIQDGDEVYACEGGVVSLPWKYGLDSGDVVMDTQWRYNGQSDEMVAFLAHGSFVPLPAFSGNRVRPEQNAGIILTGMAASDSGNYSVEVNGYDGSGTRFILNQTVVVHIGEHMMTQDGELHVQQTAEPVLNQDTDQWSIQLTCGSFASLHTPPFQVEWLTPDGRIYNSTDFNHGHFSFLLPNPVTGGNYTCRVPPQHLEDFCLEESEDLQQQGEETIVVDRVNARLTLLEKENEQLKNVTASLSRQNEELKTSADGRFGQLQRDNERLRNENAQLRNASSSGLVQQQAVNQQLIQRLEEIENVVNRHVYFHATGLRNYHPPYDTPLVVSDILVNQGNGYNSTTGYFTAPYAGSYFFIATTGTYYGSNTYVQFDLYVDSDVKVDEVRAYTDADHNDAFASVHGAVHLRKGQRVWVRSHGEEYYGQYTTFTGFLLSADP